MQVNRVNELAGLLLLVLRVGCLPSGRLNGKEGRYLILPIRNYRAYLALTDCKAEVRSARTLSGTGEWNWASGAIH